MKPERQAQRDVESGRGSAYGLALALLIAIPFWVAVGLGLTWGLQGTPITQTQSALLMIAVALEVILLRYVLRASGAAQRGRMLIASHGVAVALMRPWPPLTKRTVALSALAGAYLQYYFLDVYLQIESMRSVTVFVAEALTG